MSTPARVVVRNYTGQLVGMTAWLLQRVTGLLLLFYGTPFFKLLEIGLLATVILHAFNGIRLTVLDLGIAHGRQRKLFWVLVMGAGTALFIAGAVPIFIFSVLQR